MKDDIQFLKDLQAEMNSQDTDIQADPRFWTVGDYRWVPCPDDCSERYSVYLPNDGEAPTISDFLENLDREELDDAAREALAEIDTEDHDAVLGWIQEHYDEGASMIGERKEHFIRMNTMFLTKAEAKRHIEANHYHYTKEAHTYAMTAWRAPTVERLWKILREFDFDRLSDGGEADA